MSQHVATCRKLWHDHHTMIVNGAALRTIRERSGLTQTALAQLVGTDRSHISNIENGRRNCSDELVIAIARALKIDLPAILADPTEVAS